MLAALSLADSQYRLNLVVFGASYQDPNWEPHNCTQSSHALLPAPNQGLNPQVSSFTKVLPHIFYLVLHAPWYPTLHPWQSWGAGQQSRHSTCKIRYGKLTTLWTAAPHFWILSLLFPGTTLLFRPKICVWHKKLWLMEDICTGLIWAPVWTPLWWPLQAELLQGGLPPCMGLSSARGNIPVLLILVDCSSGKFSSTGGSLIWRYLGELGVHKAGCMSSSGYAISKHCRIKAKRKEKNPMRFNFT